ncbi:unnamed protein product [Cercopithifilaria johnstoni]|uniref:Uncharacterized protein n=1 Tax=Cercopithifilaria johnstoni TaxID=2874296 RepID=A0A8J2LZD8_9BILA|nr:unnamed protein product [Cercopithifilaria johnstoni]
MLMTKSNKPSSLLSLNSIEQLNIPHNQFSDNNNDIYAQACMPSCQCTQQRSTSIIASIFQHQLSPESIIEQSLMSDRLLWQESFTNNDSMPHLTQFTPCVSFCIPSCRKQCIHQTVISSSTVFYSSSAFLYSSQPTVFEIQQDK